MLTGGKTKPIMPFLITLKPYSLIRPWTALTTDEPTCTFPGELIISPLQTTTKRFDSLRTNQMFILRGARFLFYQGQFDSASDSFSTSLSLNPTDQYAGLWFYLALVGAGRSDAQTILARAA